MIPHPMAYAWELYRRHAKSGPFRPVLFRNMLIAAWTHQSQLIANASAAAKRDALSPTQARIADLESAIDATKYLPFEVSQAERVSQLEAALALQIQTNIIEQRAA